MKKYTLIFAFIVSGLIFQNISFASSSDTTFKANLYESQKNSVKVSMHYDGTGQYLDGLYTITVDGYKITDSTQNALDYYELKVVDLDKDDDYREIAICSYFNDNSEYQLYRFTGKKVISLGWVSSMDTPVFPGDGTVKSKGWMGFWSFDYKFVYNTSTKKYEPVYEEEYPVKFYEGYDQDIVVKESFNTYKEKDTKSEVVSKFKQGDVIKLIKAYTKEKCDIDYGELCYWYLIQDKNGKKGWLQLKDFMDKVEGLPWAG